MSEKKIIERGRNCWRIARAGRVAFLIDGDAYFRAFREAATRAERSIFIVGWDISSETSLSPDGPEDGLPRKLRAFLNALAERRRSLDVRVLVWDYAMVYAIEREWFPVFKLDWQAHQRVHCRMDSNHPPGGSHHAKIVVIDDAVAFAGGLDLTIRRWDTPAHAPGEKRRVDPDGKPYDPFHDVQIMVDGEAAGALGELARERWERATGEQLSPAERTEGDPWPEELSPSVEDVDVGIARTQARHEEIPEVREIERLHLDLIAGARSWIYVENQYFTSKVIGEALAERLAAPEGPDVVLVLRLKTEGWLETNTMDVLRARLLARLRDADHGGRLRVYYPHVPQLGDGYVNVHAKVMIADDRAVRIGSANLNNRSMGLDTECDLVFEADGREDVKKAVAELLARLLGEHLDAAPADVIGAIEKEGSLIGAVESLRGDGRSLRDLDGRVPGALDAEVPEAAIADPERPIDPENLVARLVPSEEASELSRRGLGFGIVVAALLLLAAVWRWSPLGDWMSVDNLLGFRDAIKESSFTPLIVVGAYVGGALIVFPVTLLIIATALIFGPLLGFAYALVGVLLSASVTYAIGSSMGRETVRRFAGKRVNAVSRRLARRGVLSVTLLRVFPIAPFSVINTMAGASHIRFRDYILGTILGMAPGLIAVTLFVDQVDRTIRRPGWGRIALMLVVGSALLGCVLWFSRWVRRRAQKREGAR